MNRITFVLKAKGGMRAAAEAELHDLLAAQKGIGNLSAWGAEDNLYGYGEYPEAYDVTALNNALDGLSCSELLCPLGSMRLMYYDYGIVREDKSLIRHRVFSTKLKEGCAEEYKRRHDGLIAARGDTVSEGPDSNFTIWYGAGYIFGYCEKVISFDRPMTEAEKVETIAWETRQLEIMDWLTDDVDWITGQHHDPIRRVY